MSTTADIAEIVAGIRAAAGDLALGGTVHGLRLAASLERWLDGEDFETAVGLSGLPWRVMALRAERNQSVIAAAHEHFRFTGDYDDAPRAARELGVALSEVAGRIEAATRGAALATSRPGSLRRALLRILAAAPSGLCTRQIARVLRDTRPPSRCHKIQPTLAA